MKWVCLFSILMSVNVQADSVRHLQLSNQLVFYKQKNGPDLSLPIQLSDKIILSIASDVSLTGGSELKKVFSENFVSGDLRAYFEVYFFNQNSEMYLSQQVTLFRADGLVAKCTSYFGLDQTFLVPGSCAGAQGDFLYGVAIYK